MKKDTDPVWWGAEAPRCACMSDALDWNIEWDQGLRLQDTWCNDGIACIELVGRPKSDWPHLFLAWTTTGWLTNHAGTRGRLQPPDLTFLYTNSGGFKPPLFLR